MIPDGTHFFEFGSHWKDAYLFGHPLRNSRLYLTPGLGAETLTPVIRNYAIRGWKLQQGELHCMFDFVDKENTDSVMSTEESTFFILGFRSFL